MGSGTKHREHGRGVLVSREREDARRRRASDDLAGGSRPAATRHAHVEDAVPSGARFVVTLPVSRDATWTPPDRTRQVASTNATED